MGKGWSRREFVQWMGYSSLATSGVCSSLLPSTGKNGRDGFAYVASTEGGHESIHSFAIRGGSWEKLESLTSERPVALTVSPNGRFLYAVNEIDLHRGLPTGTVEAFAIGRDGRLVRLNRRELALSATMPRHAVVSPDGRNLVVAVRGGGAYNVMPIAEDGSLGRVSGLLKEVGVAREGESRPARPEMVIFDRAGRVVSVDGGAERLNVFSMNETGMLSHAREDLAAGCGASQVAMHPSGNRLFVMQDGSVACHAYDPAEGTISKEAQRLSISKVEGSGTMAVHPSGRFLYASQRGGGVAVWDVSRGTIRSLDSQASEMGELHAMEIAPDGKSLMALNRQRGLVVEAALDETTGRITTKGVVARVSSPVSLTVLYS